MDTTSIKEGGAHLVISLVGTSKATSFACMPDLAKKEPGSENRYVTIYEVADCPNNPWPNPIEFKPPSRFKQVEQDQAGPGKQARGESMDFIGEEGQ